MINAETTKPGDRFKLIAQIPGYKSGPGETVEVVGVAVNVLSIKDRNGEPAMLSYKAAPKYLEPVTDADATEADTVPPSDEAPELIVDGPETADTESGEPNDGQDDEEL